MEKNYILHKLTMLFLEQNYSDFEISTPAELVDVYTQLESTFEKALQDPPQKLKSFPKNLLGL